MFSQHKRKGIFYRKILIIILLSASIPGLLIGGSIYWIVEGKIEGELLLAHQKQTRYRTENIDNQFTNLENSITHWAFEPRFGEQLMTLDFIYYFQETRDLNRTLLAMQGSNPLIQKVEMYLNRPQPLLFKPYYTELVSPSHIELYQKILQHGSGIYWTHLRGPSEKSGDESLVLITKIPGGSSQPFGFFITYLDNEKVGKLINTLSPYDEGGTFILHNRDNVLITAEGKVNLSDFETALKKRILEETIIQNGDRSGFIHEGSFIFTWEDLDYTVSYSTFPHIDSQWIYVSAAPSSAITGPIIFSSKLIISISLTVLCLALMISWFASRKLYSPVEHLLRLLFDEKSIEPRSSHYDEFKIFERQWSQLSKKSRVLQNRLEEQMPQVKEGFLLQLLQGNLSSYSEKDLLSRMENFGWYAEGQQFVFILIQLIGFHTQGSRFSSGDEGLVTFAASNIVEELAGKVFEQYHVINFHDLSIGLFVIYSGEIKQRLYRLGEEMTQAINQILRLRVTVTVARPVNSLTKVPYMFREVKKAIDYRIFADRNQWIDLEDPADTNEENTIDYPFDLEKEIIQSLRMGNYEHSTGLVEQFLRHLSMNGNKQILVQQGMFQLLGSIQREILQAGMKPHQIYGGMNLFEQLSPIKEPEKMLEWMNEKVVLPCVEKFSERSKQHMNKMVEQIVNYLNEHYMTPISLDSCADLTGMNPYSLSKAFKQIVGKNFIDYLTEIRMEKAKQLLRDTELKINDIAEKVGYQHSYFNRLFKKELGMTPRQYRELSRNK